MGLSFHYSGSIKSRALIATLEEEVADVCRIMNWKFHLFDDELVKGICFSPPECEPVFFSFNPANILCSPVLLELEIYPATTISVKSQFAGIEVHKALLKFIKYLQPKYFELFQLDDEGGYWENFDEEMLKHQFKRYNAALDFIEKQLRGFAAVENETHESLTDRLEEYLKGKLKDFREDENL
jgi:hypothetical protein